MNKLTASQTYTRAKAAYDAKELQAQAKHSGENNKELGGYNPDVGAYKSWIYDKDNNPMKTHCAIGAALDPEHFEYMTKTGLMQSSIGALDDVIDASMEEWRWMGDLQRGHDAWMYAKTDIAKSELLFLNILERGAQYV